MSTDSCEFGNNRKDKQRKLRRVCPSAQPRQSRFAAHVGSRDLNCSGKKKNEKKNVGTQPIWVAKHTRLSSELTHI